MGRQCIGTGWTKILPLSRYLIFTVILFTQTSCYTVVGPKLYSQSLPAPSTSGWSNIVPYPYRAYQPSIPMQYYGRYFGDPYFAAGSLQNPNDYYFAPHDSYSPSFDDSDYYSSNYLYYIPAGRRMPYYDQSLVDSIDEIQDYDEDPAEEDSISKTQRQWWLEKNVAPNEDIDYTQLSQMYDVYDKSSSQPVKVNSKNNRKNLPVKNRYTGIDGFGRKKDKEQVYGSYRPSSRKEERTWVYGVPMNGEYEDRDVRDLKSLRMDTIIKANERKYDSGGDSTLVSWASGNNKRSTATTTVQNSHSKQNNNSSVATAIDPFTNTVAFIPIYDEGGGDYMPRKDHHKSRWADDEPEQTSVFDTIKKLLALEDKVNEASQEAQLHRMLKRKEAISKVPKMRPKSSSSHTSQPPRHGLISTTTSKNLPMSDRHVTPPSESTTRVSTRTHKRSAPENKLKPFYTDEDSLDRELSALRHTKS